MPGAASARARQFCGSSSLCRSRRAALGSSPGLVVPVGLATFATVPNYSTRPLVTRRSKALPSLPSPSKLCFAPALHEHPEQDANGRLGGWDPHGPWDGDPESERDAKRTQVGHDIRRNNEGIPTGSVAVDLKSPEAEALR